MCVGLLRPLRCSAATFVAVTAAAALAVMWPACALQFGSYSHEAAFGVYLTDRLLGARALCRLLTLQLFNQLEVKISQEAYGE